MKSVYMVISDAGDGSNGIEWVLDSEVMERMEELAENGDEGYASGNGLQVQHLMFPDDFDLIGWMKANYLSPTTLADLDY